MGLFQQSRSAMPNGIQYIFIIDLFFFWRDQTSNSNALQIFFTITDIEFVERLISTLILSHRKHKLGSLWEIGYYDKADNTGYAIYYYKKSPKLQAVIHNGHNDAT